MICAKRRSEKNEHAPTTSSMATLTIAIAPWPDTCAAASLMLELLKAAPSAVSSSGM